MYISRQEPQSNQVPTLAIVGDRDLLVVNVERMAEVMSELSVVRIPGADHTEAVGDPLFTSNLLTFLGRHSNP